MFTVSNGIRVLRLSDMVQTNEARSPEIFGSDDSLRAVVALASGRLVVQHGSGNTQPHALIDPV